GDVDPRSGLDVAAGDHQPDAPAPARDQGGFAGDVEEISHRASWFAAAGRAPDIRGDPSGRARRRMVRENARVGSETRGESDDGGRGNGVGARCEGTPDRA